MKSQKVIIVPDTKYIDVARKLVQLNEKEHFLDENDDPLTILRNHFDPQGLGNVTFHRIENNKHQFYYFKWHYLYRHKFYKYANTEEIYDPITNSYLVVWCVID